MIFVVQANINNKPEKTKEELILEKEEKLTNWSSLKFNLSKNFYHHQDNLKSMKINIGDIFDCHLGENLGDEICKTRPVIVLSKTFYNNVSSQITVAPLSTQFELKQFVKQGVVKFRPQVRTHFLLKKNSYQFLKDDSVIKCEQIRGINKVRLGRKIGVINEPELKMIKTRIRDLFDI